MTRILEEKIQFRGHPLISARHKTTFEVTKDSYVTRRGDCIIGVEASKACADLSHSFRRALKTDDTTLEIEIVIGPYSLTAKAQGSRDLVLTNPNDIVIRKSTFICDRTLAIRCNRTAFEFPRTMVDRVKNADAKGLMTLRVISGAKD